MRGFIIWLAMALGTAVGVNTVFVVFIIIARVICARKPWGYVAYGAGILWQAFNMYGYCLNPNTAGETRAIAVVSSVIVAALGLLMLTKAGKKHGDDGKGGTGSGA